MANNHNYEATVNQRIAQEKAAKVPKTNVHNTHTPAICGPTANKKSKPAVSSTS